MCGIFGYIGKNQNAFSLVLSGLKKLEYRGYDSWGVAILDKKGVGSKAQIIVEKKTGKIGEAKFLRLPSSNFAFGHTRWATHGGVSDINAHPHLDCTRQLAIIHNGIIENYDLIKKELEKKGHKFISETDTEVAVHLIEENYFELLRKDNQKSAKNVFLEAVRLSFYRFIGFNAIIVMDAQTQSFVAVKNGSPLVLGKGKGENFLASDAHALLPFTREVYFLEDNELALIDNEKISLHDLENGKIRQISFTFLNWDIEAGEKGKFPHFMLKEIFDQPQVIEGIVEENEGKIKEFGNLIKNSFGTYLVGCGTAAYACLAGCYIFSKIARRHLNWAQASEFGYTVDFLTSKSFVVGLSQSGETIDLLEALKKAKEKGAKIGALVNVLGSTLYRIADYKLLLGAGVETAVVSTKAFTAKLAYLILLANFLNGDISHGKEELRKSISALREVLNVKNLKRIQKLVEIISQFKDVYIIGRGLSFPLALETALKIKEASYLHAEGFAAGELKHGVIALIEKGIPCLAFLPHDETYGATLAGAMEMKARGGFIVGISHQFHEIFDYYLPVKDCGVSSVIPLAAVGQLIGYYLAIRLGHDPDKPRNLAKSVTVK